jgi:hypothetical protein
MDCRVSSVEKNENDEFILYTSKGELSCHSLVLAAGGKAGKESGGDGSGYVLAGNLGHTIQPIHPGLTGLVCSGGFWKNVAGTRIQGRFSLRIDGERIPGEVGEVQIVEKGVSGIPVFQMCRVATKALAEGKKVEGELDFVPTMKEEQVREWIASHGTDGLVPQKWLPIMEKTGNSVAAIKGFHFEVRDSFGIERAQVTAGGVALSEIDPATMASRLVERLFVVGELLDVDGKCGGYNLHMAWSTAMLAARELTGRMR